MSSRFIQNGIDLPIALAAAGQIYGATFNPQITLKALTYFGEGNLLTLDNGTKGRLLQTVQDVDIDNLPKLTPKIPRRDSRQPYDAHTDE